MKNWQDAAAYKNYERYSDQQYAWELLRRHPKYLADWEKLSKVQDGRSAKERHVFKEMASEHLGYKWHLIRMIDPDLSAEQVSAIWRIGHETKILEHSSNPYLPRENGLKLDFKVPTPLVAIGFDALKPLAPQLRKAELLLKARQQELGKWAEKHSKQIKVQRKKWPVYLRAYDGKQAGATHLQLAQILFPNEFIGKLDREASARAKSKISKQLEPAALLIQNYRTLIFSK